MSRQQGPGDEIVKHLPGIFQSLVAAALGGGLLPIVTLGWVRLFHTQLVDAALNPVANVIAAIVLIPAFWLLTRPLSALAARRVLGKTRETKGDRLAIYVAHFGFDELSRTARDRVIASIRKEFGSNRIEALPAGIYLGLPEAMTEDSLTDDVRRKARALLKKTHGDLVILGKVIVLPAMQPQIDLRFVSAAEQFSPDSFGFSDKLLLDQDFGPEVGTALAAIITALAKPAFDVGSYSADTLRPVANRLIPLIHSIPTAMEGYSASLLFSYGLIQTMIGKQLGDRTRIEDAIAVFREALKNWTDKQVIDRALIQNNLGSALFTLGEWEQGTARLEQAASAFTEAQKEWTRQRAPKQWAAAKHNLGCVLYRLAERKHETIFLSGAVALFHEALMEQSYEREPLAWAMTQSSLGNALAKWGEWEHGMARLEQAAAVFCGALKKLHRSRMASLWAGMQNNYGTVLSRLGEREGKSGAVPLKQAVTAFRKALKEETRERAPVGRLGALNNLGFALCELATRERGTTRLGDVLAQWHEFQAVKVFRKALNERTQAPFEPWAAVQVRLALTLHNLGRGSGGEARLKEAVTVFREVLKTGELPPLHRAMTYYNLGTTLYLLAEREGKTSLLEEAVIVFREALNEPEYEQIPEKCEAAMRNLNLAQKLLDARQARGIQR